MSGHERPLSATEHPTSRLLTIPQAAQETGLPERTLRRWVGAGKLPSLPDPTGGRGRLVREDELRAFAAVKDLIGQERPPSANPSATPAASGRPLSANVGHERPPAATLPDPETLFRAALEREAALLAEVASLRRMAEEAAHLRERLTAADRERAELLADRRTQGERHAEEARELRVLLLRAQDLAAALTAHLEQPALPETITPAEAARPWWQPWGRR